MNQLIRLFFTLYDTEDLDGILSQLICDVF